MGCPDLYYKKILETVLCGLNVKEKMTEEEMENKILELMSTIDLNKFYFESGLACGTIIEYAYHEGGDQWNASGGGASVFVDLIGLNEDED